jgi:hypothetical protein
MLLFAVDRRLQPPPARKLRCQACRFLVEMSSTRLPVLQVAIESQSQNHHGCLSPDLIDSHLPQDNSIGIRSLELIGTRIRSSSGSGSLNFP